VSPIVADKCSSDERVFSATDFQNFVPGGAQEGCLVAEIAEIKLWTRNRPLAPRILLRDDPLTTVVPSDLRRLVLPSTAHRGASFLPSRRLQSDGGTLHYQSDKGGHTVQVYSLRIQRQYARFRCP
jgi:hypothetical protein